jgi:2-oxoglutarate dehydrogenase E2 component (dihydrolipoamide succinyltransferase)
MRRREIILPDLGFDGQPIVMGQWLVERGSYVRAGEQVLEVLAPSAVIDLASPADGVLADVLVDEDDPLQPGQRLAVIESAEGDVSGP